MIEQLPSELQKEFLPILKDKITSKKQKTEASISILSSPDYDDSDFLPTFSQVDKSIFDALPDAVQEEVKSMMQKKKMRAKNNPPEIKSHKTKDNLGGITDFKQIHI